MKKNIFTMILCCFAAVAFAQTETDSVATNVNLDGVEVTARRSTTKFTETGLIYDLKADPAVRTMSLLEALRQVPMVTVTADDEIRVKGNGNYSIYLNGRPYRVAQSDPKSVLRSIPANTISKIELITELDGRYDAEAGSAIINIITVKNALDGYTLSINGRLNTKPEHERFVDGTTDGISLVATKGNVNMMLGYDYTLQNMLNQPMSAIFRFFAPERQEPGTSNSLYQGELIRESTTTLQSVDGNFNYHTGRLMLEWMPDSLNSLYVDAHTLFDHNTKNVISKNTQGLVGTPPDIFYSRSYSSNTSGTAEANLIYRNYYRNRPDLCRFSAGYRFALDSEKAMSDFTISKDEDCTEGERTIRRVNGHLQEHTINADYALPLGMTHTLRFGAKDIIRLGKTRPEYSFTTDASAYDGAMNYNQNISAIYAVYTGRLKNFNLSASLRGEYSHNSFDLLGDSRKYSYNYFDVIPRVSLNYNQSPTMRYTLTYNTSVTRPGIGQLDPFRNILYPDFDQQGNPDLLQSRTHSIDLSMLTLSQKFIMQISASANRCNNPIVDYYTCNPEQGNVLISSINFARRDFLSQYIYINYRPTNRASLTLAPTFTENWWRDKSLGDKSFGLDWNLYAAADFMLPRSWSLGAQLILNHMDDEPYTKRPSIMVLPTFYANKNFLDGKLTVGLAVSSPFAKYSHHRSEVSTAQFSKMQCNDILTRGITLKLSYRFSGGKRTSLNRDTSLRNEDLNTGVD